MRQAKDDRASPLSFYCHLRCKLLLDNQNSKINLRIRQIHLVYMAKRDRKKPAVSKQLPTIRSSICLHLKWLQAMWGDESSSWFPSFFTWYERGDSQESFLDLVSRSQAAWISRQEGRIEDNWITHWIASHGILVKISITGVLMRGRTLPLSKLKPKSPR